MPRQKASKKTDDSDVPVGVSVTLYLSKNDVKKLSARPPDPALIKAVIRMVVSAAEAKHKSG